VALRSTKTVIMKDGLILAKGKVLTGFDQKRAVNDSLEKALTAAGISRNELWKIGCTGSGKDAIEMADTQVNEIKAMAKGARYFFPDARTVVDVGAEEGRAVKMDAGGNVVDFAVNEKCAAGAGVFIESMARALEVGTGRDGFTFSSIGQRDSHERPMRHFRRIRGGGPHSCKDAEARHQQGHP
jgi:benzoyl-CoA reductase subunit D